MAARLASSAARRCVRSINFFSRRGIGSGTQFLQREAVDHNRIISLEKSIMRNVMNMGRIISLKESIALKESIVDMELDNKLILGPPPVSNLLGSLHPPCQSPPPCDCYYCSLYPPFVEEKKFTTSWSSRLQLLKPKPKPKLADILLSYRDVHDREFFTSYSLVNDGDLSPQYYVYPPSFLAKQGYLFTGATSNGLLHFHHQNLGSHVLWNPLTGEYKILPKPSVDDHVCFGITMWSDHESQDCKLMYLVDVISINDMCYHFVVYSLKTNSWRQIPLTGIDLVEVLDGYGCVSGVFYCVAYRKESGQCILSFDISTETFSTLPTPNDYSYDTRYDFLEYKGYLCIIENEGYKLRMPRLWVLGDDGSWMRESFFGTIGVGWPLWFSYDGNLLYFASVVDDALVVFDRATGVLVVYLEVRCSSMVPFSQSLTQLNKL